MTLMQSLQHVSRINLPFMHQIWLAILWDILIVHACDINNLFRYKCNLTHPIWAQIKAKLDTDLLQKYCKIQYLICFELLFWFYFYSLWFTTSILWVIVKETDAGNLRPFSSWEEGSDSHLCPVSPLYSRMQRVVVWNLNYCLISSFSLPVSSKFPLTYFTALPVSFEQHFITCFPFQNLNFVFPG